MLIVLQLACPFNLSHRPGHTHTHLSNYFKDHCSHLLLSLTSLRSGLHTTTLFEPVTKFAVSTPPPHLLGFLYVAEGQSEFRDGDSFEIQFVAVGNNER